MRRSPGPVARLRGRLRPGDDTGSLALALLLTLVGVGLSALLVPMVVTALRSTQAAVQRNDALNAAQAGLDVTLGRIRAATDGTTNPDGSLKGMLADLPCYQNMGGDVSGAASYTVSYTVTVSYSDEQGNPIRCAQGFGAERAPASATLDATGTAGSAVRTLQATYKFVTTNQPIPGGLIYLAGATNLCLEANSATAVPTWFVRVASCNASSAQQRFAYGKNLNIYLVSTRNSSQGVLGACLTEASGSTPPLRLQSCTTTTSVTQQWQFNAGAKFQSSDNYCFYAPSTAVGTPVTLTSCSSGGTPFSPDASVGAGAAGASTGQLVNFQQFGRCLDVTNQDVTTSALIIWPCKQSISSAPDWNQVWQLPSSSPGKIYTMPTSSSKYCLRSPGSTGPGRYVTVVPFAQCSTTSGTTWTVRGDTHDYTTSFRIEDSSGYCLSGSGAPDYFSSTGGQNISKAIVAPCTGSTLEKWNADARVLKSSPLTDLNEK